MTIDLIIKKFAHNHPESDTTLLLLAYEFAEEAHRGQTRKSGEPYIQHPLHTAFMLTQIKADLETIVAGLLHDVPEDTSYNIDDIKKNFGSEIAFLVAGITKLGKIKYRGIERYRENLKKMFLAMAQDVRVIFIKFCDRIHNLRTIEYLPHEKQIRIAKETLEIYSPIAGLLGMWRLKWQMDDICFKCLYPDEFAKLEHKYEVEKKAERNQFFLKVKNELVSKLEVASIGYNMEMRFKHLYSIWQKMRAKNRKFNEIYDVFAVRIIVPTIDDCYKVLGIIHSTWRPQQERFKDYIAMPKPNGYRSLHTTVFGPEGKSTEFQIRTQEMNEESIYGLAAHWYYKAKMHNDDTIKHQPAWIKDIVMLQKDMKDTNNFIKEAKIDLFRNRIFVFSPKGDVFELPESSTPIDFAYAVHTDIGNKAVGARINEKITTIDQELKNGDMVEIIIEKNRQYPNRDWLKFVKTKHARDRIRQFAKPSTLKNIKDFFLRK
ncbi:MAG: RelA/SpoT family protein [Planctomycetes bacterium]|jgi:GTP pyrophosphokinase|nr:RelA/SpoT family protein [Planctomycetota bacterium]